MQAVIALPDLNTLQQYGSVEEGLTREVCGIPLLVRTIETAIRAGAKSLVVIWPSSLPFTIWLECQAVLLRQGISGLTIIQPAAFDARQTSDWTGISSLLRDRFLWLPWNWVTHERALLGLSSAAGVPADWSRPALIEKAAALRGGQVRAGLERQPEGIPVISKQTAAAAERLLVAKSGKPLDGIYSTFNRSLCRPIVRLLSHTRITPHAISLAGLAVAISAACMFGCGSYAAYVVGAFLFFLSGLCDEMVPMLASIKFRESPFGTWFAGFVDNTAYLLVFSGITAGLCREYGRRELIYGVMLIAGSLLSVLVISLLGKNSSDPARPNEYFGQHYGLLDGDASNSISRVARHFHVFLKKGVAVHYLLLFSLFGGLPLFLRLAALGSNATWIVGIYSGIRFFRQPDMRTDSGLKAVA